MAQAVTSTSGEGSLVTPTLLQLFLLFMRIGLTSFGGGLSGWLLREIVHSKRWLSEDEFYDALTVCQALPGINSVNMAIWIGFRIAGVVGSLVNLAGLLIPPAVLIILLGTVLSSLTRFPVTGIALTGAAAVGIGLALSMGIGLARRLRRRTIPLIVFAGTFFAIGVLHWPLLWVAGAAALINVTAEYIRLSRS
ncbi:MAG TPA: chromate transporter [Stellaceae bacterium]|jgi:chromate transporter|nr:chromate transporter [Stellaceae bacterium]